MRKKNDFLIPRESVMLGFKFDQSSGSVTNRAFRQKALHVLMITSLVFSQASLIGCASSSSPSGAPATANAASTLTLTPQATSVAFGGSVAISVAGSTGSYTQATASAGSVYPSSTPNVFTFTAPQSGVVASGTAATIQIVDSAGNSGTVSITISNSGSGTPTLGTLSLMASPSSVSLGGTSVITVSGGSGTYVNATATAGTISSLSATVYSYTAPTSGNSNSSVLITITDSNGASGYATLTINGSSTSASIISVSPQSQTLAYGQTTVLTATGGNSSYVWTVSGGGTLSSSTGTSVVFTAPLGSSNTVVTVRDTSNSGQSASAILMVSANGSGSTTHNWGYAGQMQSFGIGYCGSEYPTTCTSPGQLCFVMAGNYTNNNDQQIYNVFVCQ
jgi:hypothetical protein